MTVFSGGFALAIQVVATVVLARLLTPRDFGLVAMVTTFSLLLSNFGINGITEALVQREQIDQRRQAICSGSISAGACYLQCGFAAAGSIAGEVLWRAIGCAYRRRSFSLDPSEQYLCHPSRAAEASNDVLRGGQE